MNARTMAAVCEELMSVSADKQRAASIGDFARAATLRDQERVLQQERVSLGGPLPNTYRVRIEKPNGACVESDAPSLGEAVQGATGLRLVDINDELLLVLRAADLLAKAYNRGATS